MRRRGKLFGYIEEETTTKNKSEINIQGSEHIKINNIKVNQQINEINWNRIISQSKNTSKLFKSIFKICCDIYENSKETKTKIKRRKEYPWLTDILLKCCNIRYKPHKKWMKNKNNEINTIIYKKFNNNLNKRIINAKNEYDMKQFIINRNIKS